MTDVFVNKIEEFTNNFHKKSVVDTIISPSSQVKRWQDLNNATFLSFLALTMLMAQVNVASICDYWSTDIAIETD